MLTLQRQRTILSLLLVLLLAGCTTGQPTPRTSATDPGAAGSPAVPAPSGPKRITAAIPGEAVILSETARLGGSSSVGTQLEELVNAGLTRIDDQGLLHPQIAEAVPTLENGLWKLFSDGRMETTWKLKPGVKWHDGTPFTVDDVLFTAAVERDAGVARASRNIAYETIESVTAPDASTITVQWSRPFINADRLFSHTFTFVLPMPKHLLEKTYFEDKTALLQLPYWQTEFVGTGPFRLREFVRGSHLILEANPEYVLGKPKLDEIEVRFVEDSNALLANVLAGTVELTIGGGFSIDQAVQIHDRWREGKAEIGPGSWTIMYPQLYNPNPPVVRNLQFRRAAYHAIDRQQLVDTLMHGLTSVAHSWMDPGQNQYREIESRLIRYDYDPRRAAQMIEGLGYTRGADGLFGDGQGQPLSVQLWTTAEPESQVNAVLSVAEYWKQVGIGVEPNIVPAQRARDIAYRSEYPAFELVGGGPHDLEGIQQQHGSKARLPENNYVGSNRSRYMNPEFDALIDRYYVTVPMPERMQVLGQIISHMTENLNVMPLFYGASFTMVANRITGVSPAKAPSSAVVLWNAQEWNVR